MKAEDVSTISVMWGAGARISEIADAIGQSYSAVHSWVQVHRDVCPRRSRQPARGRQLRAEQLAEVRRRWAAGDKHSAIAAMLGKTPEAFRVWLCRNRDLCPYRREPKGEAA